VGAAAQAPPVTAAAPAPPASAAAPTAVPLTSFVGRGEELRRLAELLGEGRIVTLVGPGGVGKTRLARELVAGAAGDDRPICWVDLVPAREPADVPYRFADALGLREPAEGGVEQFLVDSLRPARALLVVDNCEHVIAAAARIVARLAEVCPGVVLLATSRERLAVDGERVMTVAPLPEPAGDEDALRRSPAVALFADRLRATGGPELSPPDVALVAELCRRVDRLPLAIELAAARAGSLGIAPVAGRPALDLLTGGRRTDQARHRSLRAVLDWSHDLLDSRERILFRRLAVFSGSFTVEDAESVCVDGALARGRVAEALAGLVDKSMVAGPERDRCRLLDAMRAYAAEQLTDHGEDRWLGAAHARHFVAFAERAGRGLLTAREREWAAALAERIDELRAAHRWACAHDADLAVRLAVALAHYATYYMRFELQDWAETAAALPDAAGHPLRAGALASAASGAWARGDFPRAERLAREGLAAAPADHPLAAGALLVLGDTALAEGRFGEAVDLYQEADRLVGDDQPYVRCEALGGLAIALSYQGEVAEAVRLAEAGERVARRHGAPGLLAIARYFAGEARLDSDPAAALELLAEARRLAADAGALFVVGIAMLSSVSLRARAGDDPVAALAAYREAIEHWQRVGNRTQQWVTLRNLVPVLVRAGHDALACTVHAALASAPVRLPADVRVPEADALAAAIAEARRRLGDRAAGAEARGGQLGIDELTAEVVAAIGGVPGSGEVPGTPAGQAAGSSR
jgi:predicted ATPase